MIAKQTHSFPTVKFHHDHTDATVWLNNNVELAKLALRQFCVRIFIEFYDKKKTNLFLFVIFTSNTNQFVSPNYRITIDAHTFFFTCAIFCTQQLQFWSCTHISFRINHFENKLTSNKANTSEVTKQKKTTNPSIVVREIANVSFGWVNIDVKTRNSGKFGEFRLCGNISAYFFLFV